MKILGTVVAVTPGVEVKSLFIDFSVGSGNGILQIRVPNSYDIKIGTIVEIEIKFK